MTKGAFACALNYIDDSFIAKAISSNVSAASSERKRFNWACLRKPAIVAACFALALVMVIGVFNHFHKDKNDNLGIHVISSDPQINYSVAVSAESRIFDVNEDIPIMIYVGTGSDAAGVYKMEIWSYSEHVRLKGDDPLVLTAENGDFEGVQFMFDKSVIYKENKTLEDLPYKMPITLGVNKPDENVLGQIDITVQQSGGGFEQAKTVTLYYSIRGAKIAFSTVSAEDADSYFDG